MHRSVTAPYPSGYVLAAGRLRPRRKPERKLFYTERVTYFARKVKHKNPEKCLFYWIFCCLSSTESEVSSTAYSSSSSSYSRHFFNTRMATSPPTQRTAPPKNSTSCSVGIPCSGSTDGDPCSAWGCAVESSG